MTGIGADQSAAGRRDSDLTSIGALFSFSWRSTKYAVIRDQGDASAATSALESPRDSATDDPTPPAALLPFVVISLSYILYTFTDGSVRMIVLLAAYNKGFTAMEVAVMFTLYETAGVVTNLLAGLAGARWGLKTTHCSGLALQLVGLGMLCGWKVVPTHASTHTHTHMHTVICCVHTCVSVHAPECRYACACTSCAAAEGAVFLGTMRMFAVCAWTCVFLLVARARSHASEYVNECSFLNEKRVSLYAFACGSACECTCEAFSRERTRRLYHTQR